MVIYRNNMWMFHTKITAKTKGEIPGDRHVLTSMWLSGSNHPLRGMGENGIKGSKVLLMLLHYLQFHWRSSMLLDHVGPSERNHQPVCHVQGQWAGLFRSLRVQCLSSSSGHLLGIEFQWVIKLTWCPVSEILMWWMCHRDVLRCILRTTSLHMISHDGLYYGEPSPKSPYCKLIIVI